MIGSVGWTCPNCSAIISPYQTTCAACVPTIKPYITFGNTTYNGLSSGTITFGGSFSSGTFFAAPKPDPKDAKLKEWRDWRDKVVELRDELDELIEEVEDME